MQKQHRSIKIKQVIGWAGFAAAGLAWASLTGCNGGLSRTSPGGSPSPIVGSNNPSPTASPTASALPNRPGQPFPNQLVQDFITGCTQAGVSASACRCTITRVQQTYSYEQFNEINQAMGRGIPAPESFAKIVAACKQA